MTRLSNRPCLLVLALGLGCLTSYGREHEGSRENSILLNGPWEFAFGDGGEGAETAAGRRSVDWRPATLPGPFMPWNHPSVVMWVLSNESRGDNAWEEGPFQDFVNALDPTRPTMRTGTTGTRENYDVHPCGNVTETDEGHLQPQIPAWFEAAGRRTATASEYMNDFGHPRTQWSVDRSKPNYDPVAERILLKLTRSTND